jgi:hypothetical protein
MNTTRSEALPREELLDLVRHAVMAPSGHNTQPWQFAISERTIEIRADFTRRLPVVDPDDHALFISLGAALENLRIAACRRGLEPEVDYFPRAAADSLVVRITGSGRPVENELFHAIPERQSTRSDYDGRTIPSAELRALEEAGAERGVRVRIFTGKPEIEDIVELVMEGNRRQMNDRAFVRELIDWVRFSRSEAETHGDGLIGAAMGMPSVPRWLGEPIMKALLRPGAEASRAAKRIRGSSALVLFVAEKHEREHWVRLGQSFERVALAATLRGIRNAHMNMPCEVPEVREQFRRHLGLTVEEPLLLLRIGYGRQMPRSPRRPTSEVIVGA